jgi:chromosome segregation ATPase
LQGKIAELKQRLKSADEESERASEERRRAKAEAMKKLGSQLIAEKVEERNRLFEQHKALVKAQSERQETAEQELREISETIAQSELEAEELSERVKNGPMVLQRAVEEVKAQADSMRQRCETSRALAESARQRLSQMVGESEAKRKIVAEKVDALRADCDRMIARKKALEEEFEHLKRGEESLEGELRALSDGISKSRALITEKERELAPLQVEVARLESLSRAVVGKCRTLNASGQKEITQLQERLQLLGLREQRVSDRPSLFGRWKELTKLCGELLQEAETKRAAVQKYAALDCVFEHTLELVAERQEQLDALSRTIRREKDFFHQRVAELTS